MKKLLNLAICAALGLMLGACASGGSQSESAGSAASAEGSGQENAAAGEGYLNIAINADIQTADVHKTSKDYMVPLNIFDRLVEVEVQADGSTKLVPSLAKEWKVSDDGKTYTLTLQEGVKFHNGADFNAEDVVYSLKRIIAVEGGVNADMVSYIEGSKELMEGSAKELSGVKAIDDYTVEIKLSEPYGGFMACLSTSPVAMMDAEATEAAGDAFGNDPALTVGTGPFKLKSRTLNSIIVLERNEDYWKGASALPGVNIRIVPDAETRNIMFRNKELDILDLDYMVEHIDQYKADFADRLVSLPRVGISYFTFNESIEPMSDVKIRKAISMAIDRQAIVDELYNGIAQVENGIFPRGLIGHNADLNFPAYDPEAAKALLAGAGYPGGFDMEIAVDNSSSDIVKSCVEVIAAQLQEIGVNAQIKNYDESTWLATRKDGSLGSFMSTWTADYNDPDNFIYTFFGNEENTKLRSINYYNKEIMDRVSAARTIVDEKERMEEYKALEEQIVIEDRAWLPLFSREHYFAVGEGVENFVPNWAGISDIQFYGIIKK